ncbi:hypothetical protein D3C76_984530 [compost metagenome]
MLIDACAELTDTDLNQVVTFGHGNEKQATIRWGLWHMADHELMTIDRFYIDGKMR